ncbi:hypothetical protein D3C78_1655030 [compost metagenome]
MVVLSNDGTARTAEVEGESRHVAAEIVNVEHQVVRQVLFFTPYHPTQTQRGQAVFMAGRVDGFYARQTEVPNDVALLFDERRNKAAGCRINVDRNIQATLFL